jgi:hypothetical protein
MLVLNLNAKSLSVQIVQAEIGVDAGAYARLLMVHAKEAADASHEDVASGTLSPQAILESAFYRTNVQGEQQQHEKLHCTDFSTARCQSGLRLCRLSSSQC